LAKISGVFAGIDCSSEKPMMSVEKDCWTHVLC